MEKLFDPRNSKIKNIFPTLSSIVNYASFKPGSKEIRGKWWSYKKLGQGCHSILKIKFQDNFKTLSGVLTFISRLFKEQIMT